jgi:hypothetical protein
MEGWGESLSGVGGSACILGSPGATSTICEGERAVGGRSTPDGALGGPIRLGALLGGGGDSTFVC